MNFSIIMLVAIVLSWIYFVKYRNRLSITIAALQTIAVIAAFSKSVLTPFSTIIFTIALLVACFYPIMYIKDHSAPRKKYVLWLFLYPIIMKFIFGFFHWPGANLIALSMLIPIAVYVYVLTDRKDWLYEIGFMIVFFADALCRFIVLIMNWIL